MLTDENVGDRISRTLDVFARSGDEREAAQIYSRDRGRSDERSFSSEIPACITTEISTIPRVCLPRVFSRRRENPPFGTFRRDASQYRVVTPASVPFLISPRSVRNPWPPFSIRESFSRGSRFDIFRDIRLAIREWKLTSNFNEKKDHPLASLEFNFEEIYF